MKKNLLISMLLSFMGCWTGMSEANALDKVNDVYQITNGQDLADFSSLVASGNGSANAVLTADIDMADIEFAPIGTLSSPYSGTFDGQQHYIMSLTLELPEQEFVGLFGVLSNGAYIKNVIVDWSCSISGSAFVGGIAGGTSGQGAVIFENCGNEAAVGATNQNAAGICGVSMGSACSILMYNCFNTGGIAGERECAALCGWVGDNGSVIQNCYNAGFIIGMDGTFSLFRNQRGKGTGNFDSYGNQGTLISSDEYELASGSVCYQMNANKSEDVTWYQKLGEDAHPVPFASHGVVYAVGELNCDGTSKGGDLSFSNTDQSIRDAHTFENGICTKCGDVDRNYKQLVDGYYELANAIDLNWFAAMVNHGVKKNNARLTADIDFTEYTKKDIMIGGYSADGNKEDAEESGFVGVFDGQNHKITIDYKATYDAVALFKVVSDATIRNLVVEGTIESDNRFMGGLGFVSRGTSLFENIIVNVNITGSFPGDATDGGIFAVCHESPTFRNCAFVGSMNIPSSEGSAAIIGYAHGQVETIIENCYVAPTLLSFTGNSTVIARHVGNIDNCYYTENIDMFVDEATSIPVTALTTGELCYLLNEGGAKGAWRQNLPGDAYPVPFADHKMIYANGSLNCDGSLSDNITYSNEESQAERPDHSYDNDICSVCGARIIRSVEQLQQLASDVNDGTITKSIIVDLVEDLDLTGKEYVAIGSRTKKMVDTGEIDENQQPIMREEDVKCPFIGTFDGHGHRIDNMLIEAESSNQGLFGLVQAGSTIKNVVVSGEIYSIGHSAGIVGTSVGKGTLTIENCGSEVMVNVGADGANGAGILGVNDLSAAYVRIINCYNTGDIVGSRECGNISGWLGDRAEVINSWASGIVSAEAIDGTKSFARFNANGATFTNCYEVLGTQDNVGFVEYDDLESGKLCYLINKGAGEVVFYQKLGTDLFPVFDETHGIVYYDGNETYSNDPSVDVKSVAATQSGTPAVIYSLSGARQQQMQRGMNIVRMANGTVKKVLVK